MPELALKINDVKKVYKVNTGLFRGSRPLHAVNGVSLNVNKGEVLGLVGESGCGKTTIAKLILGIEDLTSGAILMNDADISSLTIKDRAQQIQPIFQDPYSSLNPRKTIFKIISLPLRALKLVRKSTDLEAKVNEIMKVVGLPPQLKYNYPNQLSGGQRQRVAVARALITKPGIVLCDEPTSALDVSVQAQILNLLMELKQKLSLTYVFISHDLAVVEHIATQIAVMYLGRIVEMADTREFFNSPSHPYSQALLASVLTPDPDKGLPDTHLGITYPNPIDPPSGCTFHPRCPKKKDKCTTVVPQPITRAGHMVECHYPDNF